MKDVFISIIEDDLNNSIPLYDRVKEIGKQQKYVDFEALNEMRNSRKIYENILKILLLLNRTP